MSSFKEREVVESKDLRPIQSGIGSILESNRILSVSDIPTQAYALRQGTLRSLGPGFAGWVGSRVGGLASGFVTGNPYLAAASGFVGSTAGGGAASAGAQWLQNKVLPYSAKEIAAMNRFPITNQVGGYLSMTPFLRGSSISEWSKDPVGRLKNAGGEYAGEFFGSLAISAATGNLRNFNVVDESIGAAIESVLQNEETKLGNYIAKGIGLPGSTIPPNAVVRPTVGAPQGAQRSLVAEAIAGTPAAPTAAPTVVPTPAVPKPPVATTPGVVQPPVVAPGAPAAPAGTVPPAATVPPVATVPPTAGTVPPVATVPPAASVPPATATPPAAQTGTIDRRNVPVEQEELRPVQPRPADSPERQQVWDELYGETHKPDGTPVTFSEPRPESWRDKKSDPSYKPEFGAPDRGTGNMPVASRPRIIPESIARSNLADILDFNTPEEAMNRVNEEAAKNPQIAEYVKNNKVAIDQAIQANIEWNKKYGGRYYYSGTPRPSQAELELIEKYDAGKNPEYAADLKRRQDEWDAKNANDFESSGWPKDNRTATARFREGQKLRQKAYYRKMIGPEGKRQVAWFSQDKDMILPGTVAGRRVYRVGLNGTDSMIGDLVNPTAPAMITESLDEAVAFIENHRKEQAATQAEKDAREQEARDTEKDKKNQAEAKDTKDTPKPTSGPVEISNIDQIIANGGGKAVVTQGGTEVEFDKFAVTIDGNEATVAYVEMKDKTQAGKGIGKAAYIALGNQLAAKGITLMSSNALLGPGQKLWLSLVRDGYAVRKGNGYAFVAKGAAATATPTPTPAPTAQPQAQADIDTAKIKALFEKIPEYKWASPVGDAYSNFRMEVMKALGAQGVTKSNSGVNKYRELLIDKLGIDKNQTIAAIDKDILRLVKQLLKGSSGGMEDQSGPGADTQATTTTKPKGTKPAGDAQAAQATITKPITDDEKKQLKELNLDEIRQDNEDNEDDSDPNEKFHAIFDDIAQRNGYLDKPGLRAYLESVFGKDEFNATDASKALKDWTATKKPVTWDKKTNPIPGTVASTAVIQNSRRKKTGDYGGDWLSALVVFGKDGEVLSIHQFRAWRGRPNGTPTFGGGKLLMDVDDAASQMGFDKPKGWDYIVSKYGKDEAAKIAEGAIRAFIDASKKYSNSLDAKNKEYSNGMIVQRRNNRNSDIAKGDIEVDPLNLALGLDGKESDREFFEAFEKKFGLKFVSANRGYAGYGSEERYNRNNEFKFSLGIPGGQKHEPDVDPDYDLNNDEWREAANYEALKRRVESPDPEAVKLREKLTTLNSEGSAYKKAKQRLQELDNQHAERLFEKYKIFRPGDKRYVSGTKIPQYYPEQKDLRRNEDKIESAMPRFKTIYRNQDDMQGASKIMDELFKAMDGLKNKIMQVNQRIKTGSSKDVDADFKEHARLVEELRLVSEKAIPELLKLQAETRDAEEKATAEQEKAGHVFQIEGTGYTISFNTDSKDGIKRNQQSIDVLKELDSLRKKAAQIGKQEGGNKTQQYQEAWDAHGELETAYKRMNYAERTETVGSIKDANGKEVATLSIVSGAEKVMPSAEQVDKAKIEQDDLNELSERFGGMVTSIKLGIPPGSDKKTIVGIIKQVKQRLLMMQDTAPETESLRGVDVDHDLSILYSPSFVFDLSSLDPESAKIVSKELKDNFAGDSLQDLGLDSKLAGVQSKLMKDMGLVAFFDSSIDYDTEDGVQIADKRINSLRNVDFNSVIEDALEALAMNSGFIEFDQISDMGRTKIWSQLTDLMDKRKGWNQSSVNKVIEFIEKHKAELDYSHVKELFNEMRDFKSGKMFGDKGAQQEAKPTKPTKPAKPAEPAAQAPAAPAMDSVTAIAQEKEGDTASLKAARTKLRAVIEKLGSDSQQAQAMAKNIQRAEQKQASFNQAADNTKPYGTVPEPAGVTKARAILAQQLKKGTAKSVLATKATLVIDQYEVEYDLFTGQVTEEGIKRVSNRALEAFLQQAQDAIDAAGGMSQAGDTLKAELGSTFKLAEAEMERRVRESERKDQYGDILADIASIVRSSKGAIAIPTLPQALGSSFSETSQMFDKGMTTGANSILRQPMFGIDVARYKSDKDYKAQVNSKAEKMIEDLATSLLSMGWSQFDPSNVSSSELMDALVEAGMGKPLVPKDGVTGASWKGDVGVVSDLANTDVTQLPQDLFKASGKPKQVGAKPKDELFDTSDTFNLSGETVSQPNQAQAEDTTQDATPEAQEPAYIAQARAQLAKLQKSGKNLEQQRTLRDTIEQYEATKKQTQPEPEATQQAEQPANQELKDEFNGLVTDTEATIDDLESTAGGQAKADKAVNGKKGVIAMARDAISKSPLSDDTDGDKVPHQDAADMLRAAATLANEIADSNEEAASNIEDMGREDTFSERQDMIDQLRELAEQLDQLADMNETAAGTQAEGGEPTAKLTKKDVEREIARLREENKKEMDAVIDSNMGYRDTTDAMEAIRKKYEPQFKKLTAQLKKLTKNDPGAMSVEGAIDRDGEFARFVTGLKKKLDAGTITQAEYDEAYARVQNAGQVKPVTDEADKGVEQNVIQGLDIARPLPDRITNQKDKDSVAIAILEEIRNQVKESNERWKKNWKPGDSSMGPRDPGDLRSIKGAGQFAVNTIKAFLDKNPNASYLEVVANLYTSCTPNTTKFKSNKDNVQDLYAIVQDAFRTASSVVSLTQIANGVPEGESISFDTVAGISKDADPSHILEQTGLLGAVERYLNNEDAPYSGGEGFSRDAGRSKDAQDELVGNTAFGIYRQLQDTLKKLVRTGKYTTSTTLLDAAIAEIEAQVKILDTPVSNEILTKIKAYANSRKGDQPFSRRDRFKDDNDKAQELDTRIDRNAKNRQGDPDARKGFTGMISRVLDELRLRGEITAKEAEGLTRIMNYIGSQFFSGEKMAIKNDSQRGYYGMYSFGDKVMTIFRDAMRDGRFEYTAAHELAHLLTKYLPEKDRKDLINEWRSARMKFLKQNPGIAAILPIDPYADFNDTHFSSLDVQKAESVQPGASKMFIKKEIAVGLRGKTKTIYVMAATDEVYQIFNADEFFAENFARTVMKRLNSDPAYTGSPNTWREKLASLWDMIKTGFRQMFGKDVAARILADFAKGKITPDMKGNYGLQDLHNAIPSQGDKADLATWNTRHGQEAMTVTEQSERELIENVRKSLDKSMTIKDAMHMILRGAKGGKMELMKLLTSKYNREYEIQFSSKSYEQLYSPNQKTSEGKPINAKRVRGAHIAGGQYIRLFPEDILASAKKHGVSFADALAYVLTHEVIHSYTLDAVKENSIMRRQAADLVKEIRDELSLTMTEAEIDKRFYGLSSPAELLTECLIDTELRDIANSIKSKTKRLSELNGETIMEKIISLFQNAMESIGIKVNRDSVLERVTEMIAIGRDDAAAIKRGTQFLGFYSAREDIRERGNFKSTNDYSYAPDSPTAVMKRTAVARDKTMTEKQVSKLMAQSQKAREDGNEFDADLYERMAANAQRQHDEYAERVAKELNDGVMPMVEQAIPDLKKIDGNDTPSARETLLGIRDDVMPSIGPANRQPVRKSEKKTITQIAWDVVSGRYFSGLSTKAHQNADRHSYSDTVKAVANMIHSRPGVDSNSTERDIPTAIMTSRIRFQNKFNTIMDPLKEMVAGFKDTAAGTAREQREIVYRALHDMIRGEKPITKGKLGEVASKLKDLFVELRDYRTEAGEKLGDIEDYFPAVYDSPRIATERQGFVKDATEAYRLTIQKIGNSAKYLNELSKMSSAQLAKELKVSKDEVEAGVTKNGTDIDDLMQQRAIDKANAALAKELGITKEEVENGGTEDGKSIDQLIVEASSARANELFETHLRGMGSSEFDSIFGSQTGTDQENTNLSRVFTGDAQKVMAKWQVADPFRVVGAYITSSAKKAEMVRKFGAEGEVWKGYAEQMEADGVPYETISEMRELVRLAAGYGVPPKGKAAQTYVDSITMMTAASAMGRGFLNNLVEPVTMGIRAGNPVAALRGLVETWGRFAREVAKLSPAIKAKLGKSFWDEYGKEIGTIHSSIEDAWMATHSMDLDADRADPRFRWITNRIYQANLMDASEVAKQQASHAIGYSYILGIAKLKKGKSWMNKLGMDPAQSTTDQLNELGVPESEHENFADFVMSLEKMDDSRRMKAMTENSDMAKLHQEAMVRFSYQSSVRSNRAHKPVFQDDLFGKTVLQLMNFSYSFAAEVNSRLFSMTKQAFSFSPEGKNYNLSDRARMAAPIMSGLLSILMYKLLFSFKDELYPTEGTERRKRDPELLKWVNATSYAGFLGPKVEQLIKIVKRDQAPGGPVGQSLVNVARATTTAVESAVEGKDMAGAKRQAAKASIPIIKGTAVAGASAVNPLLGAFTTQAMNTTGWANELTKDETKSGPKGVGDALFAKPVNPRKPGK